MRHARDRLDNPRTTTMIPSASSRSESQYLAFPDSGNRFSITYAPANDFRWRDSGEIVISGGVATFTARRRRPFWFSKAVTREIPLGNIANLEQVDATVRLEVNEPAAWKKLQFSASDAATAQRIASLLPTTKTESFTPLLAEKAAFESTLIALTPRATVTLTLIATNLLVFLVAASLGAGLFQANPAVMIRLGTDYTPLTLAGQWWRLFTSTFLHFGIIHIALNMWALYVNGVVAERIFGHARYLLIYLVAGLSGSVASLLWHPIVNGAGASGAIFGVLGAMIAFFVKREGVPPSVIKAQLTSVGILVLYSLANASRMRGIDNAAHLGGLAGGLVMGFILSRPLDPARNDKSWTLQWVTALGALGAAAVLITHSLARLTPPFVSLGGISIEMTPEQVLQKKGNPVVRDKNGWVYNAVDSAHDGVLTAIFTHGAAGREGDVVMIEFAGHDRTSAPPEIPYLNSATLDEVILKFGQPIKRWSPGGDQVSLFFRNGVYASARDNKVFAYGVFDMVRIRN